MGLFLARDFVCDMPTLTDIFVTIEQEISIRGYDTTIVSTLPTWRPACR